MQYAGAVARPNNLEFIALSPSSHTPELQLYKQLLVRRSLMFTVVTNLLPCRRTASHWNLEGHAQVGRQTDRAHSLQRSANHHRVSEMNSFVNPLTAERCRQRQLRSRQAVQTRGDPIV